MSNDYDNMEEKMMVLSTAHVPGPDADWGDLRVLETVEHEHGWLVFVGAHPEEMQAVFDALQGAVTENPSAPLDEVVEIGRVAKEGAFDRLEGFPDWLRPIWKEAIRRQCRLILFDVDGGVYEQSDLETLSGCHAGFPVYDW